MIYKINYKTLDHAVASGLDLAGKKVLLRIDTNVAIKDGRVLEDFRLKKIFPVLGFLKERGAKTIIIGHIESTETDSLEIVYGYMKNYFPVQFVPSATVVDDNVRQAVSAMDNGQIIMLENLRQNAGEKANSAEFSQALASLADIYINEAFSVSHRAHASIVGVPSIMPGRSYAGPLFNDEVTNLAKCFSPAHPFTFILGGAKFDTKLPLINKFLGVADNIFIGGALANDCFRQKGLNIGQSVVSSKSFDLSSIISNPKVILPCDVVVKDMKDMTDPKISTKLPTEVLDNDKILDAGERSISMLGGIISRSKFILWNGPLGQYEAGFKEPTMKLATIIADKTSTVPSDTISVLGGGDTLTVISELDIENKFSYVSSAGGAMLDFLANETLPGIEALG